jgi:hypothetical protein
MGSFAGGAANDQVSVTAPWGTSGLHAALPSTATT